MEFNISSVCVVVFSTAGFFWPFFPFPFVMLTKMGVWYFTSDVLCILLSEHFQLHNSLAPSQWVARFFVTTV
jgi:hypothetical protein